MGALNPTDHASPAYFFVVLSSVYTVVELHPSVNPTFVLSDSVDHFASPGSLSSSLFETSIGNRQTTNYDDCKKFLIKDEKKKMTKIAKIGVK